VCIVWEEKRNLLFVYNVKGKISGRKKGVLENSNIPKFYHSQTVFDLSSDCWHMFLQGYGRLIPSVTGTA
jgi:hypothetical protein